MTQKSLQSFQYFSYDYLGSRPWQSGARREGGGAGPPGRVPRHVRRPGTTGPIGSCTTSEKIYLNIEQKGQLFPKQGLTGPKIRQRN